MDAAGLGAGAYSFSEDDAAIWEEVRGEVHVLERELREMERDAEQKQTTIRKLREAQQRELNPSALVHSSGAAETLSKLMEELRAVQLAVKAESERQLELSEAIDRNNTELYKASTQNHTMRNEREASARQLAELAQEQELLASQLQDLQKKEREGEEQLQIYARMQETATKRLHESQAQELASQAKDVAAELAELEGLRSIIPILDQQADHATQTVQGKLQELHEQAEMRMQLDEHVDQLYGPGALGGGGAPPPYREQMLHELAREYAEVQKLRQEVIEDDLACTKKVQAIDQETAAVRGDTSHINVEISALYRKLEEGTERIQQLQERVVEIKAAIQDSVSRADEHRQNLMRGDEIVAQRLHAMERRLRDEKAMRNLRREEMANITERHRQLQAQQIEEMRENIRKQEADLTRQLQENGFAKDVLGESPTHVRRVAVDTLRQPAMVPWDAPALSAYNSSSQSPLRPVSSAIGGHAAPGAAYGLASPPPGRGPPSSTMLERNPVVAARGGSMHFTPREHERVHLQEQPGRIAKMVSLGNKDATMRAAALKAAAALMEQGKRR